MQMEDEEVCAILVGVSALGIYSSETNSGTGTIIRYDLMDHYISLIPSPLPETETHPNRKGW